ncbi:hypothetical protein DNU06_15440 [Putridiphycobacter roseus]|uniref:DUF4421 domain-containing protein n=1 Tax=Putridiphycobacter roseus TaxID=2219161 RepID=A0A2W1MXK2_9FLAO|nr:hypothetical protein [Putridiphycobacter roseus]PZE15900.1 hypothetical protein DNU06_15440 [Putridiphycobacter roseus]
MRKEIIISIILFIAFTGLSQTKRITTGDGSLTKELIYEDDPSVLPKWEINIQPFSIGLSPNFIGAYLEPRYRCENLSFSMPLMFSYSKYDLIPAYNDTVRAIDCKLLGHYELTSKESVKEEIITIKNDSIIWRNINRNKLSSYYGDFGIGYCQSGSSYQKHKIYGPTISFDGGAIRTLELIFGFSREKSKAIHLQIDSVSISQFRINRLYVNGTLGLVNEFDMYFSQGYSYNAAALQDARASEFLKFIPFGWRIGYCFSKSIKHSSSAFTFGIETGQKARYKQIGVGILGWTSNPRSYSNTLYINIRFGFSFGGKTKYTRKKAPNNG